MIILYLLMTTMAFAQQTFNSVIIKDLAVNGKSVVSSTTEASKPCPSMTTTQRNALTATNGDCVYNTTTSKLNTYDGALWVEVGSGGGGASITDWVTATGYTVGTLVIESNRFYRCLIAHTSGAFATDLAALRWGLIPTLTKSDIGLSSVDNTSDLSKPVSVAQQAALDNKEDAIVTLPIAKGGTNNSSLSVTAGRVMIGDGTKISSTAGGTSAQILHGGTTPSFGPMDLASEVGSSVLPIANGGTDKALTVGLGKIAYTDADSFELLPAGTSGKVLASNGALAPSWEDVALPLWADNVAGGFAKRLYFNNQSIVTKDAANSYVRVDTGNRNIILNGSFEAESISSGWTSSGTGTETLDTSFYHDGRQGFKSVTSSQTIDLSQSSTLYAANFADSVQCLASVRLKTSHTGAISICAIQAGTVSTTDCVTANADNKWGLYSVPFLCGATSNGISIVGASGTGTTYIDDAYVGAAAIIQNADSSKIAGESYWAGTTGCTPTRTSTSYGALTDTDCPGPTVTYSSMGTWLTTDSNGPIQIVNSLPPGVYKAKFIHSVATAAANSATAINDGTTTCYGQFDSTDTTYSQATTECTFVYTAAGNRTFSLYGRTSSGALDVQNADTAGPSGVKFILEYFGNNQVYNAQCGANCVDVFSFKASSTGVVSAENQDFINGNGVQSVPNYTYTFNTGIFTVAPNCVAVDEGSTGIMKIVSVSSTTLVIAAYTDAGVDASRAHEVICQKTGADFTATRLIQGTFKDVDVDPGTNKPITKTAFADCDGASLSSASQDGTAWISSSTNISGGVCTLTLVSGTFAATPKCLVSWSGSGGAGGTGKILYVESTSSTSVTLDCEDDASAGCTTYDYTILCKGARP